MRKLILFSILTFLISNCGKNGKYTGYYENGQISWESNYKDDLLDGQTTHYYENGQLEQEGYYKDGSVEGKWTFYNEDGSFKKEEIRNGLSPIP